MTDTVLDFSGLRPGAASLKANSVSGVIRYLGPPATVAPADQWKVITRSEYDSYAADGIDITLNWEWYTGRMLEGYNAGSQDGIWALQAALALGHPLGRTIYFSHDTSVRNDPAVLAYLAAAQIQLGSAYFADAYSGIGTIGALFNAGKIRYGWQTTAWSDGKVDSRVHIYQDGKQWYSGGADENVVLQRPIGSRNDAVEIATATGWTTLAAIAAALGISLGTLLGINPGHGPADVVTPGQQVTIPAAPTLLSPVPISIPPVTVTPPPVVVRPVTPTPVPTPAPSPTSCTVTVRSGDTLSGIAKANGESLGTLLADNPSFRANPNRIYPGEHVALHACGSHRAATFTVTVQAGQTLSGIAESHGISLGTLLAYNTSYRSHPNLVRTGARIVIPN